MGERVANSAEWKLLDSLSVLLLCMFQQLLPFVLLSVSQASYDEPRLVYEYETLKVRLLMISTAYIPDSGKLLCW